LIRTVSIVAHILGPLYGLAESKSVLVVPLQVVDLEITDIISSRDELALVQTKQWVPVTKQPAPAPAPKKAPMKQKERPAVTYTEDRTTDPSSWTFPDDKPEYLAQFMDFMGFIDNKTYEKNQAFSKERLLELQPKHVLAYLTHKAFGTTKQKPEDRPTYARSNHIKNIKMKLSYFMPSGAPWADLPNGTGHGNPTRHKAINMLIVDIIQFEVRREGSDSRDVRDMTAPEFHLLDFIARGRWAQHKQSEGVLEVIKWIIVDDGLL
jgi:hypothetical protein